MPFKILYVIIKINIRKLIYDNKKLEKRRGFDMELIIDMDHSDIVYKESGEFPERFKVYFFVYRDDDKKYKVMVGYYHPCNDNNKSNIFDGIGTCIEWNRVVAWKCLEATEIFAIPEDDETQDESEDNLERIFMVEDDLTGKHLKYFSEYIPAYNRETDCWCVRTEHGLEIGDLSYVAGEFSGTGLIYHFEGNHGLDHEHYFETILERIIENPEGIKIETEYSEYSQCELEFIQGVKQAISFVKEHNRPMTRAELRENDKNATNVVKKKLAAKFNLENDNNHC